MGTAMRINLAELRTLLHARRMSLGLSIRQAAQAAGVPYTSFSRVLRGENIPDRENLVLLLRWIGQPLEHFTFDHNSNSETQQDLTTPEAVAHVLLADKKLTSQDVDMLMAIFRVSYDGLVRRNDEQIKSDPGTSMVVAK